MLANGWARRWGPRLGCSSARGAIWPFVRQFSKVDIQKFENDNELTYIRSWLKYYTNHNLFEKLMKKYKPWDPFSPEILYP